LQQFENEKAQTKTLFDSLKNAPADTISKTELLLVFPQAPMALANFRSCSVRLKGVVNFEGLVSAIVETMKKQVIRLFEVGLGTRVTTPELQSYMLRFDSTFRRALQIYAGGEAGVMFAFKIKKQGSQAEAHIILEEPVPLNALSFEAKQKIASASSSALDGLAAKVKSFAATVKNADELFGVSGAGAGILHTDSAAARAESTVFQNWIREISQQVNEGTAQKCLTQPLILQCLYSDEFRENLRLVFNSRRMLSKFEMQKYRKGSRVVDYFGPSTISLHVINNASFKLNGSTFTPKCFKPKNERASYVELREAFQVLANTKPQRTKKRRGKKRPRDGKE
jgi:hypothetical protein